MDTGLTKTDRNLIKTVLEQFPEIEDAIIFGSRANGTYKKASDVDLAIKGRAVTGETLKRLDFLLNEGLPLSYVFDVVHYESVENRQLVEHIDTIGKPLTDLDRF
jgi:predicted nucleotidyltransferase